MLEMLPINSYDVVTMFDVGVKQPTPPHPGVKIGKFNKFIIKQQPLNKELPF